MTTFGKMSSKDESITPIVNNNNNYGMPKPTDNNQKERLALIDDLKLFLATAATDWDTNSTPLKRFHLPNGESVSCVLWEGLHFITGTDIVRSLTFRFHAFGRPITNTKKFEEGIFSDLRNLKPGIDAQLEDPKSSLLDMLYKNNCIRTQKKQKVFFWYSVPHDRLFLDALERELKREKMGLQPTTIAVAEPATSTSLDTTQELFDQLRKSMSISAAATAYALEEEISSSCMTWDSNMSQKSATSTTFSRVDDQRSQRSNNMTPTLTKATTTIDSVPVLSERAQVRRSRVSSVPNYFGQDQDHTQQQQQKHQRQHYRTSHGPYASPTSAKAPASQPRQRTVSNSTSGSSPTLRKPSHHHHLASHENQHHRHHQHSVKNGALSSKALDSNSIKKTKAIFGALPLFDGSPTYKQRRRRAASVASSANQQQQQQPKQNVPGGGGGPNRIRRHTNCHLRTAPTSSVQHRTNSVSKDSAPQPTSRLAMAARAAGLDRGNPSDHPHYHPHQQQQLRYQAQQQQQVSNQHRQQNQQRSSVDMHQCSMPLSSDPVMTPTWNAMMDTSLIGLGQGEVFTTSNSTPTSHEFFNHDQLGTYDVELHQHTDPIIKSEVNCSMVGRHFGYHHPSSLHRLDQGAHQLATNALESIAATTADTTTFGSNAETAADQETSTYQHHLGGNTMLRASPDSTYSSFSSSSSSLQPSQLENTTTTTMACIVNGMVSPVEDLDLDMKDVLSIDTTRQQQIHPTAYSPGQSDHYTLTPTVADMNPPFSTDFMVPPYTADYSEGTGTMLSPEDEFSSTSSSSPSSILHYQHYYDAMAPPMSTNDNHSSALLSPLKPDMYPYFPTSSSSIAASPNQHYQRAHPSFYHHDHHHHGHQHVQGIFHHMSSSPLYHANNNGKHQLSYAPLTTQDMDLVYR